MHWEALLDCAAQQFNGGSCSFPPANQVPLYSPPNQEYERLLFDHARSSQDTNCCSAGWIVPKEESLCYPVFVAHSLLSAIWLLRETLPKHTLSNDTWACLAYAAKKLSGSDGSPPPSAQKPSRDGQDPLPPTRSSTVYSTLPSSTTSKRSGVILSSTPKRTRSVVPDDESSSPPSTPVLEAVEPAPSPQYITTVTNNNRRADQARTKKLDKSRRNKLGLDPPPTTASAIERGCYNAIQPKDEQSFSWIIGHRVTPKSDFFHATKEPYRTASSFLDKTRSLGSINARFYARRFLQAWRERGTPFYSRLVADSPASQDRQIVAFQKQDRIDMDFRAAWDRCEQYENMLSAVNIGYRWAAALLGRAYANKIAQIEQNDLLSSNDRTRNRYGKGKVRTEAINALMMLVPGAEKYKREAFRTCLLRASRWYELAQGLGWGILALMPSEDIPNTWLERDISAWGVGLWVQLVRKERPDVCAAAEALDSWLGPDGIAGGPISGKTALCLEMDPPVGSVVEVEDSEGDTSDDSSQPTQTQATPMATTPVRGIRQMTLEELFKPLR